ncbi:hypothetical protein Trydic_g7283 [Trypoxylus dichotomus]
MLLHRIGLWICSKPIDIPVCPIGKHATKLSYGISKTSAESLSPILLNVFRLFLQSATRLGEIFLALRQEYFNAHIDSGGGSAFVREFIDIMEHI